MSACQLIAKALSVALCAVESSKTVLFYLTIDMAIFFAYKVVRREFFY